MCVATTSRTSLPSCHYPATEEEEAKSRCAKRTVTERASEHGREAAARTGADGGARKRTPGDEARIGARPRAAARTGAEGVRERTP